ncbi:RNA polymerase sigma factor [Methyloceanibacter sp.]|jgi:RNA polymerase sigma-70 factor (ECF subfamily)|uniref:RNA polymerase sigma factor n=1 Tax=Methyloceanibacter sp. TaxID=1965321 RepID=UPI002C3ED4ED|nr:RNA polymerase sigma factor [Methyloceanibacter sp.]
MAETALDYEHASDIELCRLIVRRDRQAVRLVTRRNNQRLYRAAWSVLKNRAEAEEAVQDGYLKAFAAIGSFDGRSSLSTWLTRIVVNEALGRRRTTQRRARLLQAHDVTDIADYRESAMAGAERPGDASPRTPEAEIARAQIARLLERAIGELPETFRTVFVLREVEGLSVEETADALQLPKETVKTRDLRARRRLQDALDPDLRDALRGVFPFAGADCDALTDRVLTAFVASASAG